MKESDKDKESSYVNYWDVNNLYGWAISQNSLVNGFNCFNNLSEFNEDFIKSYSEKSNEGYFFRNDVQYPENFHEPHNDLPFLHTIKKFDKFKKSKAIINHGLVLNTIHKVI